MPFNQTRIARGLLPQKMFQYLAMGKPVVSTDLFTLRPFNKILYLANNTDQFVISIKHALEEIDNKPQDDLNDISVVPNPYIVFSDFDQTEGDGQLRFTRLPLKCTIAIYTINGELVKRIYHEATFDGNEVWDLKNEGGNEVAPGLYIYVIEADNAKKIDKFAIIR